MSIPTITAAPAAPNRATMTDAEFSAAADAFTAWWVTQPDEYNALGTAMTAAVEDAVDAASASTIGTSTTSVAIGTGSKGPFTTQAGKNWTVGTVLMIASAADPSNYMLGQVTAYSGTSLTVNVTHIGGSGTLADWDIGLSGPRGSDGTAPIYTQIATSTPTSVATVTFSSIPTTYSDLHLVVAGLSPDAGTPSLQIELSANNGTNWTSPVQISPVAGVATDTFYGALTVFGYREDAFNIASSITVKNSDVAGSSSTTGTSSFRLAGGVNAMRLSWNGSQNFDAGTVTLKGI